MKNIFDFKNIKNMKDCNICCIKSSTFLDCKSCDISACTSCYKKWFLEKGNSLCLNCDKSYV